MPENIGQALILTTVAGFATSIGSIIAYFIKKPKMSYLSFSLGFSAGVMIFISFVELLPEALAGVGKIWGFIAFFIGILFIGLIDRLVPEAENPHHLDVSCYASDARTDKAIMRTGPFTALAIGIHNFPEGLVTLGATLTDVKLGMITAFAAGIMVYISLDELIPTAHRYGHEHTVILGVALGVFIMALGLLMF